MNNLNKRNIKSRGTELNPKNRFEQLFIDYDDPETEHFDEDEKKVPTMFFEDSSQTILVKNDSPDLSFNYGINPYRGCEHGCVYCFARPTHEYLGFSSGLDFETKIMIKKDAAVLLDKEFRKKSWVPQRIMFSGNTDCYQPIERKLKITRACIEVFQQFNHPLGLITKNALVTRDIDILSQMAKLSLAEVVISVTTLDRELSRKLEPRTSVPSVRLDIIKKLAGEGVPVGVNVAPIIPGLTDEEVPAIVKACSESGATFAAMEILRLPYSVKELFLKWLDKNIPSKKTKIISRITEIREGKLNDSRFGSRMIGTGKYAESISRLFKVSCDKYVMNKTRHKLDYSLFRVPSQGQIEMF